LSACNKEGIKTVAFKAETDPSVASANARTLLERKGVDAVCLNVIDESNPFGGDSNAIDFITRNETVNLPKNDKLTVSLRILEQAESL